MPVPKSLLADVGIWVARGKQDRLWALNLPRGRVLLLLLLSMVRMPWRVLPPSTAVGIHWTSRRRLLSTVLLWVVPARGHGHPLVWVWLLLLLLLWLKPRVSPRGLLRVGPLHTVRDVGGAAPGYLGVSSLGRRRPGPCVWYVLTLRGPWGPLTRGSGVGLVLARLQQKTQIIQHSSLKRAVRGWIPAYQRQTLWNRTNLRGIILDSRPLNVDHEDSATILHKKEEKESS